MFLVALVVGSVSPVRTLDLVNLTDQPLRGVAVSLPAGRLYRALKVDFGTPLEFKGLRGKVLPCQLDEEAGAVLVLADLPAGGRARLKVHPAREWPKVLVTRVSWDQKAKVGELTNGLLTVRTDGRATSLLLPDGRAVFEGLRFFGWLIEKPIRVPGPRWAWEKGIPFLSTTDFKSLEVKVRSGQVRAQILLKKEAKGKAEGKIVYHERLLLHPLRPVVEYWLEMENLTDKPLWLADCDGIIYARWGEAMKGPKVLELPTKLRHPITGPWFCVRLPKERWVIVHGEEGRSLGIVNLTNYTSGWCFPGGGFFLYQAGPQGGRPIPIPPKGRVTFGVAFTVLPREQAFEGTRAVFEGRGRVLVGPPVSAFLEGRVLLGGKIPCFKEGFSNPGRWLVRGGRLERGGRFVCEGEEATATLPLEVIGRRPLRLRLEVDKLKGKASVVLRPLEAGKVLSFEVSRAGRLDWDADVSGEVVLQIRLEGRGSIVKLRRLYLGPKPLPPPRLLSPLPGAEITDIASFFEWEFVEGAEEGYEVQFSRSPEFEEPLTFRAPELGANKAVFFPEEPLPGGRWFWRVRAVGKGGAEGEWSEGRSFSVSEEHPKSPLIRPVGRERPLFILHSPSAIDLAWATIPDDLKPYCALRVEVAERGLDFFEFCKLAERVGANVIIQCSGPRGGVYGEVYNRPKRGQYGRQSLADLEWAFKNCPHVIGAIIVEQFSHHFGDPTSREYARRLLMLCAKYGRLFVWADLHGYRGLTWLRLGAERPEMLRLLREYRRYAVVLHKMNCWREPLTTHGSVMGLWLCDFVGNFGVEPEDWYWHEAGFGKLGESFGIGRGKRELFPPTFWGQMMLLGLASGGTCWCLEPWLGLWETSTIKPRWALSKVVFPLMRVIVKWGLVPSKEEVLSNIKAVCKVERGDLPEVVPPFGPFRILYEGTCGLRHDSELIPDTGRYFFIPLLPVICKKPPEGAKVFRLSDFKSPKEVRRFFDALYPPFYEGDAFVVKVGNLVVAMNSRENEDVRQKFRLPLKAGIVKYLEAELGPHSYLVARVGEEGLLIHVNGRIERVTTLRVGCEVEPMMEASPRGAVVDRRWDGEALTLVLSHKLGALDLRIGK